MGFVIEILEKKIGKACALDLLCIELVVSFAFLQTFL